MPNPSFAPGQVFDAGLIGEGVLHLLHWAKARLALPSASLVMKIISLI